MLSVENMKLDGPLAKKGLKSFKNKKARPHKQDRIWFILADSEKAKIYRRKAKNIEFIGEASPDIPYEKLEGNEDIGREPNRGDALYDKGRQGFEPSRQSKEHEEKLFIDSLTDYLQTALDHDIFDKLVLIAAPKTLGKLRQAMTGRLKDHILNELSKDLVNLPANDVKKHLETVTFI